MRNLEYFIAVQLDLDKCTNKKFNIKKFASINIKTPYKLGFACLFLNKLYICYTNDRAQEVFNDEKY